MCFFKTFSSWGSIPESKGMRANFQKMGKKGLKKSKKGQNTWKFGQKWTKFENNLERGMWLRAIIARNKLPERALLIHPSTTHKYIKSLH